MVHFPWSKLRLPSTFSKHRSWAVLRQSRGSQRRAVFGRPWQDLSLCTVRPDIFAHFCQVIPATGLEQPTPDTINGPFLQTPPDKVSWNKLDADFTPSQRQSNYTQ